MRYSFPNLEPVCFSMSSSHCCFLSCIQSSQEAGQVARCSHLLRNSPQSVAIRTLTGVSRVSKAEVGATECPHHRTCALEPRVAAAAVRKATATRSPHTMTKGQPCSPQSEKSLCSKEDPTQSNKRVKNQRRAKWTFHVPGEKDSVFPRCQFFST